MNGRNVIPPPCHPLPFLVIYQFWEVGVPFSGVAQERARGGVIWGLRELEKCGSPALAPKGVLPTPGDWAEVFSSKCLALNFNTSINNDS